MMLQGLLLLSAVHQAVIDLSVKVQRLFPLLIGLEVVHKTGEFLSGMHVNL